MAAGARSLSPFAWAVTWQPLALEAASVSAPWNLGWLGDSFRPVK